jgi:xylulokinase
MEKESQYFIGIDLGTNGIKAGIVNILGEVVGTSYWETDLESDGPGTMEQDIDYFYVSTLNIIRDVIEKTKISAGSISAVSIDGQMGGVIGIDKDFRSVTGFDMGLDLRSESFNSFIHNNYSKELFSITCGSPRNIPKIMWWKKGYPQIYKKISKFVTLNGYVTGKICSLKSDQAVMDYTLLSFFGNDDAESLNWSKDISDSLRIDLEKLPRIVKPWFQAGTLSRHASEATGLKKGIPVMAGAGDQPAGYLGAGLIEKGDTLDVSGSSTVLQLTVDEYRPDNEKRTVMYMPSILRGIYHAFTYINGGGITLRWFRDEFLNNSDINTSDDLYSKIEKEASEVPLGSEGLIFIPYMGGRQCPYSDSIKGSWIGLNWGHKKGHLYRAILEGLAYDYRIGVEALNRLFPDISISKIPVTGGIARSGLFNKIKADVLGVGYTRTIESLFAIRGSGLIAGYGIGAFKDLKKISKKINILDQDNSYKPEASRHKIYSKYYNIFKKVIEKPLKYTFDSLNEI